MRFFFSLILIFAITATVSAAGSESVRLRLRWGGENASAFGEVRCTSGAIRDLSPISMFTDNPGGAWCVNGTVQIRQATAKKYNGFDMTVPYQSGAMLSVQINTEPDFSSTKRVEIPLDELLTETRTFQLSEKYPNFQCAVNRVPGDRLQVLLSRDNLVFAPRDMFQCTVRPSLCSPAGKTKNSGFGELEWVLYRGRETFEINSGVIPNVALDGRSPVQVQFPIPEAEGVYDVVLTLKRKTAEESSNGQLSRTLTAPFSGFRTHSEEEITQRRVQFIVLSDSVVGSLPTGNALVENGYALKMEIDPTQTKWWENLDKNTLKQFRTVFPDMEAETLQNKQRIVRNIRSNVGNETAENGASVRFLEIPQSRTPASDPAWEAFPLVVENPGMPHVLEVEYLANQEQTFSVSILEPNSTGAIVPPGIDSGVNVPTPRSDETSVVRLDRHHILFWPQSRTPLVLVVNRHAQKPVCLGKIRFFSAGNRFQPHTPLPSEGNIGIGTRNRTENTANTVKQRLIAMMIGKPMFTQAFSSSEMNNDPTGLCVSDWLTFYGGGNRMIEYMEHVGYNGAVLTVYADGSSIYPSPILNPTPRYDNGTYFPTAQDPVRKDIVEMLFRMFDRKNLKLIPAMDFSSPIPSLETAARFPNAPENSLALGKSWTAEAVRTATEMRWHDPLGNELVAGKNELKDGAPYYNILNPVVQETVLQSISEVARRYGHHPAFGGISLQLHADSFLVLPNPQWGMTAENIRLFALETGTALPGQFTEQVQYLTFGAGARAWLEWRARRMTLFYRRAAALLSVIPGAKLYLNGTDLFQLNAHPELMPRLNGILSAEDVLLYFGLEIAQLKTVPNLVVNRPQKVLTNRPLTEIAGDLQWAQTPGTYRIFQEQQEPGTVFYHAPEVLRLASFDQASPFKPTFTWMATTYASTTVAARRPYAEALAMLDAFSIMEGGWNPVFGKEEALRGTIRTLAELPAVHFSSAMSSSMQGNTSHAVIFRSSSAVPGTNYAYAVNTTPFTVRGKVYVQPSMNQETQQSNPFSRNFVRLDNGMSQLLGQDARGIFWEVELGPYQIEGIRFAGAPVMLLDPVSVVPDSAKFVFQREYAQLQNHLEQLRMPSYYLGLKNPGFERIANRREELPFWNVTYPNFGGGNHGNNGTVPVSMNGNGETTQSASNTTSNAELDSQNVIFGDKALCLRSTGKAVRVMSAPFEVNPTGRLTIHAWLRTEMDGTSLPLRLIVEGVTPHGKFYRTAQLSGPNAGIGQNWKQLSIHVNDLPLEKETRLSLGFELYGTGTVWVDNIQLSDTHFSESEIQQLQGIFSQFGQRIALGDIAPCVSAMECYWMRFLKENIAYQAPPESNPLVEGKPTDGTKQPSNVEYIPTRKMPQLPHLGQMPALPSLPKLPGKDEKMREVEDFETETEKKESSYFDKMKNLLPW